LDHLAQVVGFNYTLYESPDRKYGTLVNGTWSGMMKEIEDGVSTFSVLSRHTITLLMTIGHILTRMGIQVFYIMVDKVKNLCKYMISVT
jgi:hypothetical protein